MDLSPTGQVVPLALSPDPGRRKVACLTSLLLALASAAVLIVGVPAESIGPGAADDARGGLGLGGVAEPRWCWHALDPRRERTCPTSVRPIPGILPFCPHETGSLLPFPDGAFAPAAMP